MNFVVLSGAFVCMSKRVWMCVSLPQNVINNEGGKPQYCPQEARGRKRKTQENSLLT